MTQVGKSLQTRNVELGDGQTVRIEVFESSAGTPTEYVQSLVDLILPDPISHWTALAEKVYLERILKGEFVQSSLDLFFIGKVDDEVIASVGYQVSRRTPDLGSFGWVHTRTDQRNRGISTVLTETALEWFRENVGLCLHLGTVNPVAHHIYEKHGFRDYHGIVMRYVAPFAQWEGFDEKLYANTGPATIRPANWGDAAGLGALYAAPSPWFSKDFDEGLFSHPALEPTRYVSVPASLLLRMERSNGKLLILESPTRRIVGAANLRPADEGFQSHVYCLNFLVHRNYMAQSDQLLSSAGESACEKGAHAIHVCIASHEFTKKHHLSAAGFRQLAVIPNHFKILDEYRDLEVYSLALV